MRVIASRHARERYFEYTGTEYKDRKVYRRLRDCLALGARVEKGRIKVPLGKTGLVAVCAPVGCGWLILTFIRKDAYGKKAGGRLSAPAKGSCGRRD
jgi:hypothetical protein